MLKWFRARASVIAPLLLLSLASLAVPHAGDSRHDSDGDFSLILPHDVNGHGVGRPSSTGAAPDHCAICHFSRPFRPHTQVAFLATADVGSAAFTAHHVLLVAKANIAAQPPLRAPPASPALG